MLTRPVLRVLRRDGGAELVIRKLLPPLIRADEGGQVQCYLTSRVVRVVHSVEYLVQPPDLAADLRWRFGLRRGGLDRGDGQGQRRERQGCAREGSRSLHISFLSSFHSANFPSEWEE